MCSLTAIFSSIPHELIPFAILKLPSSPQSLPWLFLTCKVKMKYIFIQSVLTKFIAIFPMIWSPNVKMKKKWVNIQIYLPISACVVCEKQSNTNKRQKSFCHHGDLIAQKDSACTFFCYDINTAWKARLLYMLI